MLLLLSEILTHWIAGDTGIGTNPSAQVPADAVNIFEILNSLSDRLPTALVNSRMDSALDATGFEAAAVNLIWDEAMVASTGAPAITGSMRAFMEWWATLSRNVVNQTATTTTVRNDADDGDISTSTVSDDGSEFVRGKFST